LEPLGNLVDRYLYGAVFDFLVVRLGEVTLFVCNLADIAITLGTFGLLIDSLVARSSGPTIAWSGSAHRFRRDRRGLKASKCKKTGVSSSRGRK